MFNNKFGLTDAVLNGAKTMTRRLVDSKKLLKQIQKREGLSEDVVLQLRGDNTLRYTLNYAPFQVGEIVAIAQSYSDVLETMIKRHGGYGEDQNEFYEKWDNTPPWRNKMFVRADLMPHHIRITNVKIERLQEISDSDCLREGVLQRKISHFGVIETMFQVPYTPIYKNAPREAFAALIDKVGKKGDWDKNPLVYVYEFEVVD